MENTLPRRAAALARSVGSRYGEVENVTRFPTGLCHYVFDVNLRGGESVVVRVAEPESRHLLRGAIAWSEVLTPLGVPLPGLLSHDVRDDAPLPYLVLERLPGDDLGAIYGTLTVDERRGLARTIADVERQVGRLGPGAGYGYSTEPGSPAPHRSWSHVVDANLARSGTRFSTSTSRLRDVHEHVSEQAARWRPRLEAVAPVPFLDDLTTKNVIVSAGQLTGVVDVDVVCFGDPLYTPALTKAALVAADQPTDYVHAWLEHWDASEVDEGLFDFYCAVFCLDLLSEHGQMFNEEQPVLVEATRQERLLELLVSAVGRSGTALERSGTAC